MGPLEGVRGARCMDRMEGGTGEGMGGWVDWRTDGWTEAFIPDGDTHGDTAIWIIPGEGVETKSE